MAARHSSRSLSITSEKHPHHHYARGTREALIHHGITREGPFPGDPGEKKTVCRTTDPHGRAILMRRSSKTTFSVQRDWSEEEKTFLEAQRARENRIERAHDMPESLQVNPARTEALLRGYFNTWAMYGLMLSDQAFFDDQLPEKRTDELPVVRRFYAEEPARHTKYEEQFYDLLEESKRLRGTMRELDRIGRQDIADRKEQDELGQEAKPLERAAKNLQEINAEMRLVRRDSSLGPEDKRARLDELTVERNALIKATVQDAEGSMKAREQTP